MIFGGLGKAGIPMGSALADSACPKCPPPPPSYLLPIPLHNSGVKVASELSEIKLCITQQVAR